MNAKKLVELLAEIFLKIGFGLFVFVVIFAILFQNGEYTDFIANCLLVVSLKTIFCGGALLAIAWLAMDDNWWLW